MRFVTAINTMSTLGNTGNKDVLINTLNETRHMNRRTYQGVVKELLVLEPDLSPKDREVVDFLI